MDGGLKKARPGVGAHAAEGPGMDAIGSGGDGASRAGRREGLAGGESSRVELGGLRVDTCGAAVGGAESGPASDRRTRRDFSASHKVLRTRWASKPDALVA